MSDNTTINSGTGDAIRDVDRAGVKTQVMLLDLGGAGPESLLSSTNPLPVTVTNFPASQAVTGPLTDTQLRASAVPVSGPLTDTQLRATAVPVSLTTASSVSVANFPATYPVTGTFWQTTQPVSIATPVTLSTASTLPVSGTFWQTTQPVSIATVVAVNDNAGSLTVDAPFGTPVAVRLSDGTTWLSTLGVSMNQLPASLVSSRLDVNVGAVTTSSTLPVSIASLPALTTSSTISVICSTSNTLSVAVSTAGVVAVGGNISTGTAEAGNPIKVGGAAVVAKGALPTAASSGVRVAQTFDAYGRAVARKGDTWVKTHDPGPAAQASCNSTAQAAGVRNVCTSLALSLTSSAAATATNPITFVLYDGTTAGTALWQIRATMPIGAGNAFFMALGDLWIEGTAATAMTLATNAATTTTVSASVSMTGTISQ